MEVHGGKIHYSQQALLIVFYVMITIIHGYYEYFVLLLPKLQHNPT